MQLRFEDCLLDSGTREVFRGERQVHLSPKAFQLLELLARSRPTAISKEEIHQRLWPGTFVADGNLANLVNEIREGLGDDARQPRIIRTVQRFGYAFEAKAESLPAPREGGVAYRLLWGDREIALAEGANLIGRDQDAVVWVDDVSVSRHHARIVIDASGARLEDLGSKNGTYVGSGKVGDAVSLRDGDAVRLGSVAMVFRRFEAGTSTETLSRN
jgi:DNA-binding winged helix-turn-helix (wHTH) protein